MNSVIEQAMKEVDQKVKQTEYGTVSLVIMLHDGKIKWVETTQTEKVMPGDSGK